MKPNIRILSMVWNDKYVDLFKRALVRSLTWDKNKAALAGATWHVVTAASHAEEIERTIWNALECTPEIDILPDTFDTFPGGPKIPLMNVHPSEILAQYFNKEVLTCINTQSKMLLAPPDTIFGNGSIPNILRIGEHVGTCVAVPHVRVLPTIFEEDWSSDLSNAQLVHRSFKHLHSSWVQAKDDSEKNNSLLSGCFYKEMAPNLYSVQHRLPTVYLAAFRPQDYVFFVEQKRFDSIDHVWAGQHLIRQERLRTIGSSDLAFIAEVTDANLNIPQEVPPQAINPQQPDAYYADALHHCINRLFICGFRGEE